MRKRKDPEPDTDLESGSVSLTMPKNMQIRIRFLIRVPTLVLTNGSLSTQENPEALRYTAVSSGTGEGDFEKMKAILAAVPEVP
jgi:hypothetical protein